MTKPDTQKAIYTAIRELLELVHNMSSTGEASIVLHIQQGSCVDYSVTIENKSCIRRKNVLK